MLRPCTFRWIMVFLGFIGIAALASAAPSHVTVTAPVQFEIIRDGHVSGTVKLRVGTDLILEGTDGESLLVRINNLRGRVLASCTSYGADGTSAPDYVGPGQTYATPSATKSPAPTITPSVSKGVVSNQTDKALAVAPPGPVRMTITYSANNQGGAEFQRKLATVAKVKLTALVVMFFVTIVSYWRLFTKAGKPGWAIVVPIYNLIVLLQVSGKPTWWILLNLIPFVNIVVSLIVILGFAENFGKGKAFGLGLFFLPFIFGPVLAFGNDEFMGAKV